MRCPCVRCQARGNGRTEPPQIPPRRRNFPSKPSLAHRREFQPREIVDSRPRSWFYASHSTDLRRYWLLDGSSLCLPTNIQSRRCHEEYVLDSWFAGCVMCTNVCPEWFRRV